MSKKSKSTKKSGKEMKAVAAADQENARLAEERAKSPDGMTASERAMATSADAAAKSKGQAMPAPEVLASVPAYDKKDKKWDTCIREGKYEHVVLDDRFENEDDAKAAGDAWLAKYTKADEAGRRKMMGWKPAKGGKAGEKAPKPEGTAKREPKAKTGGKGSTRGPSGLDVAAQLLKDAGKPMKCKDVVAQMLEKGLWKTEGKTPAATIYAAIIREIGEKGKQARFAKTGRGEFEFNAASEKKEA